MLVAIVCIVVLYISLKWKMERLTVGFYDNRHVMITGCDTGFGNMLALRLDSMGYFVYAGCLTEYGANELRQRVSSNVKVLILDVTKLDSINGACSFVKDTLPAGRGLWGLVNNAGIIGSLGHVEWIAGKDYEAAMKVNLVGMVEMTRNFLPLIMKEKGRVVNMTSIMGRIAACNPPYVASKFAAEGYSDILRRSLKSSGVTVHILEPGFFDTNLVTSEYIVSSFNKTFYSSCKEVQKYYGEGYKNKLITSNVSYLKLRSKRSYQVIDAFVHALSSKYPKYRYVIGLDANVFFRFLWMVPEWVADSILASANFLPDGEQQR